MIAMALALLAAAAALSPTPSLAAARLRASPSTVGGSRAARGSRRTMPLRGRILLPALSGAVTLGLAAHISSGMRLPALPIAAGLMAGGTAGLLVSRAAARREREQAQARLAEAVSLLAADIRSGRQVSDAVAAAAPPIIRLERDGGPDGGFPIGAVWAVSERSGAPIAAVLDRLEEDLRARMHQRREIAAQLSGARSTGVLLAVLPLLGIALGAAMGARPLAVLLGTPAGQVALAVGVGLDALGVLWTSRIVATAGGEP